jgi:probable phosphoglycerate mutase
VSTIVHLVRHGRTTLNAAGRYRGRADPPLDDEGLRQAAAAGARLADAGLAAVYHSPLLRARQTAEAVGRAAGASITERAELIDIDYGNWEALTPEEAAARDPSAFRTFMEDPLKAEVPGGESVRSVADRMARAISALVEAHPGQAIAAVSHELPIRVTVARARGLDGGALWGFDLPTGAVVPLVARGGELHPPDG